MWHEKNSVKMQIKFNPYQVNLFRSCYAYQLGWLYSSHPILPQHKLALYWSLVGGKKACLFLRIFGCSLLLHSYTFSFLVIAVFECAHFNRMVESRKFNATNGGGRNNFPSSGMDQGIPWPEFEVYLFLLYRL